MLVSLQTTGNFENSLLLKGTLYYCIGINPQQGIARALKVCLYYVGVVSNCFLHLPDHFRNRSRVIVYLAAWWARIPVVREEHHFFVLQYVSHVLGRYVMLVHREKRSIYS